jgi:xanthine dehydrogenase iron-sulfur cluster and FAD-binding subunit A
MTTPTVPVIEFHDVEESVVQRIVVRCGACGCVVSCATYNTHTDDPRHAGDSVADALLGHRCPS